MKQMYEINFSVETSHSVDLHAFVQNGTKTWLTDAELTESSGRETSEKAGGAARRPAVFKSERRNVWELISAVKPTPADGGGEDGGTCRDESGSDSVYSRHKAKWKRSVTVWAELFLGFHAKQTGDSYDGAARAKIPTIQLLCKGTCNTLLSWNCLKTCLQDVSYWLHTSSLKWAPISSH